MNAPPTALQYNDANGNLYVAVVNQQSSRINGFIALIDKYLNSVKDVYAVGVSPRQIEYNPKDNNIYVANSESGDVYVIDSESNTSSQSLIPVGRGTLALKYNPLNNNIYEANFQYREGILDNSSDNFALESPQNVQVQKLVDLIEA